MNKASFPFSHKKYNCENDQTPVAYDSHNDQIKNRELLGDSFWLSKKMVNDGCSLEQTLQLMEERCKSCNVISPVICVDQCETWKIKKEIRDTNRILLEGDHGRNLLTALKNERRLAILAILEKRFFTFEDLQKKLKRYGFHHSKETMKQYLEPLKRAGLVKKIGKHIKLTLYGRKIRAAITRYDFVGQLPIHSDGYEERILRSLLNSAMTRSEISEIAPSKSLSRTLSRLLERKLIINNSPSDRVFYFRTKRPLSMEKLSPTQKKICNAIPQNGISARDLSKVLGISLRRVYKYLRGLRGKKLMFRRYVPIKFELSVQGRMVAEFLKEISHIQ